MQERGFFHWAASRLPVLVSVIVFLVILFGLAGYLDSRAADHLPRAGWTSVEINRWIIVLLVASAAAALGASFVKKLSGQIALVAIILLLLLASAAMVLVAPRGWLFALGVLANLGVIWSFLAVRSVVRRRRLEVVVYLSEFLLDAKDDNGDPIEMASLRLALEKYLLENDALQAQDWNFAEKFDARQKLISRLNALERAGDCSSDERFELLEKIRGEDVKDLLKRANALVVASHRMVPAVEAFFSWIPSYLPFVTMAGLFFAQFAPVTQQLFAPLGLCTDCGGQNDWGVFWLVGESKIDAVPAPVIIATFAFAGAYLHALNDFVRGVVSYDLGPTTFLRAFKHTIAAVVVSVVSWYGVHSVQVTFVPVAGPAAEAQAVQNQNASSDGATTQREPASAPAGNGQAATSQAQAADVAPTQQLAQTPLVFLVLAFIIGMYPDLGVAELVRRSRLQGLKRRGERLLDQVESTPLEMLDGVDYSIRLRLEEFGIIDVQNLATANPILLFAETPMFGLYQSIDWIAQAQLCLALGPDTFLKLRDWRLRTIFDLERALHDPQTPTIIKTSVGAAMLEGSMQTTRVTQALGLGGTTPDVAAAEALGRIIMDDLHVRRLRQIWKIVRDRLGRDWSETLYPPPRPSHPAPQPKA